MTSSTLQIRKTGALNTITDRSRAPDGGLEFDTAIFTALRIQHLDRKFHIALSLPDEETSVKEFSELEAKIQGGTAARFEGIIYDFLCGASVFPRDAELAALGQKWIRFHSFGGRPLSLHEKINLAAGLGAAAFSGNTRLAAMYASGCFGLTPSSERWTLMVNLFSHHASARPRTTIH